MNYTLIITDFKSGTGFQARCTCGQSVPRSSGCSGAGYWYGRHAAKESFVKHVAKAHRVLELEDGRDGGGWSREGARAQILAALKESGATERLLAELDTESEAA